MNLLPALKIVGCSHAVQAPASVYSRSGHSQNLAPGGPQFQASTPVSDPYMPAALPQPVAPWHVQQQQQQQPSNAPQLQSVPPPWLHQGHAHLQQPPPWQAQPPVQPMQPAMLPNGVPLSLNSLSDILAQVWAGQV